MKKTILCALLTMVMPAGRLTSGEATLRAPAYPLVTIDPYTSAWSASDRLFDRNITHWTGRPYPLLGVAKIDGVPYRFMGKELPDLTPLMPTSEAEPWEGRYTFSVPGENWYSPDYDSSSWDCGSGCFGKGYQGRERTLWYTPQIWVLREFSLDKHCGDKPVYLEYSHDDDCIIYINGIKVVDTGNRCVMNARMRLPQEAVDALKPGRNVVAAWCHDRGGAALIDFGLYIDENPGEVFPQTATQISAEVRPMNTVYTFECGPVALDLTFTAPVFLDNLDLVSRPVNYITYNVRSLDGKAHDIDLYFEAGREWAIDNIAQTTESAIVKAKGLAAASTGNTIQRPLNKSGDNVLIDWGHFYLAAPASKNCKAFVGTPLAVRNQFLSGKKAATEGKDASIGLTFSHPKSTDACGYLMAAYDDVESIQYFGKNLRPYWNRNNNSDITSQLNLAVGDYASLMERSAQFDRELIANATMAGGEEYASLCALAYRQAIAAHKLVESPDGKLLWFSKENFSNGSIGTVDITYPSAPMFLLYNPELAKGFLNFIFEYSESLGWKKPFAAHDVGTYPLANGQTYGGDMPVEESGNMLIVTAAIATMEGNANYAASHWPTLTTWADYLVENGLDPENQLCTDDFAGHFAHNANLSIKAIIGIASYARLAEMLGKKEIAARYFATARKMAEKWEPMANDGNHYKLTFDKPGTWSQKYNLVWDKLLGLDIFPASIAKKEIEYYLTRQNAFGLPLDCRRTYTKTDWIMWTATMSPDKDTFMKFITPVFRFFNETTDRVPMSDWVFTERPEMQGFQARAVVAGYFIKMLSPRITEAARSVKSQL